MLEGIWHSLQKKFTRLALRKLIKENARDEFDVLEIWEKVHNVLICWPGEGLDLLAARVVLNRVRERFPNASLTLLALPGVGASAPAEIEAELINVSRNDLSFFGIPKKNFCRTFYERGFDLVVDLSPKFEPLAAYFCLSSKAPLRVGFAGPMVDQVYNFQVSPRSDRLGIDRYRVLARYIG